MHHSTLSLINKAEEGRVLFKAAKGKTGARFNRSSLIGQRPVIGYNTEKPGDKIPGQTLPFCSGCGASFVICVLRRRLP